MSLKPILMTPAYRHGDMTPWGGDGLKTYFGKDIPDGRTGEALEVSAIGGLCSRDERGTSLPRLIDQLGARLTGAFAGREFPLLLKLLDAKDKLSVQVHPDDAYARIHEQKLGKTEAWVILHAKPGAQIVYGVKAGVTKEQLLEASKKGAAIEELLRFVPVRAGQTYYIPAGMVHAIGAGITLYEIQQSSDVTYRFYDWERRDDKGKLRQLHIDAAVAVTDTAAQLEAAEPRPLAPGRWQLLCNPHFTLERWTQRKDDLPPDEKRFRILTALSETTLAWPAGEMRLNPGQTALLPADGETLTVTTGEMLLSYPSEL